jgi:protoheme ferro-lyase
MYKNERSKNPHLYDYLEKNLLRIEIINNGVEQIVIFPKYPVFNSLTSGLRDTIMNSVSRDTHRDKIVSLLAYTSAIKNKI